MADPDPHGPPSAVHRVARLPLHLVRKLVGVVPAAIDGYFAHRLPNYAAAVAYRVLFSLAPLAIVLVSVFGLLLRNDDLRTDVIDRIVGWLPVSEEGSQQVADAITRLANPASLAGLVSLALFAWAATGMMAALRIGLEVAFDVPRDDRRPVVRAKLVDLALVVGAGVLVILAIAASFAGQVVTRFVGSFADSIKIDGGVIDQLLRIGLPLVVSSVVVMLLFRFVPSRRIDWRGTLAGGITSGLLLVGISLASALVYDKASGLSAVYGSLTVVFVFLYSVYLYASAILFGAQLADVWSRELEPATGPLVERVRSGVAGLFVRQRPKELDPPPDER